MPMRRAGGGGGSPGRITAGRQLKARAVRCAGCERCASGGAAVRRCVRCGGAAVRCVRCVRCGAAVRGLECGERVARVVGVR